MMDLDVAICCMCLVGLVCLVLGMVIGHFDGISTVKQSLLEDGEHQLDKYYTINGTVDRVE